MDKSIGLVLGPGPDGWWDSERVSCPQVLRDENGRWYMWYYGRDPEFDRKINLPTGRCGMAVSDDGISWKRVKGPLTKGAVFEPSPDPSRFDSGHVGVSQVEKNGDTFLMWYFGGNQDVHQLGPTEVKGINLLPGCAFSFDGLNWARIQGPYDHAFLELGNPGDFDAFACGWPKVVRSKENTFLMYYHSMDLMRGFIVGCAESEDGIQWSKIGEILGPGEPGAFDERGAATRTILENSEGFSMLYEGVDSHGYRCIGLAISKDGRTWHKQKGLESNGSVFSHAERGARCWDSFAVGAPCVVENDKGEYCMYYIGSNEVESDDPYDELGLKHQIGMAVCENQELTLWRRWNA